MKKYFTILFMVFILSIVLSINVCANTEEGIDTDGVTNNQITVEDIPYEVVEEVGPKESSNNENQYYLNELEGVMAIINT